MRPILPGEPAAWRGCLREHHYLGDRPLIGESIRYVAFDQQRPVAVLGWASATLHNQVRDRWIGWDAVAKRQGLHRVVNNVRFLMLPAGSRPHLASSVLAANLRRLNADWQATYGHPVFLAETFVDTSRFRGTCYRASNWVSLGETRGWSRSGLTYWRNHQPKTVFVYPLVRNVIRRLCDAPDAGDASVEAPTRMFNVQNLPLEHDGALIDFLRQVRDPRDRRGTRHSLVSILSIAMAANACGARSLEAIAQWVEELPEEERRRFGCPGGHAPSEATIRRTLGKLDAGQMDQILAQWAAQQTTLAGTGVAIDGKTIRGSRDGATPAVHVVEAVVHGEGYVVSQTRVADKTNEIKSVAPLLAAVNVEGAVITGDAMFTQKEIATYLVEEKKADFLFTVKDNQPTLKRDIEDLHLESFPPSERNDQ